ncbi:hypothetical protein GQ53DRAFT_748473 [Thozetella sp. PMI_491]|nr:hypothetical protein GQ53DRAFT_748473 [Thozetella sp. PMI_491]
MGSLWSPETNPPMPLSSNWLTGLAGLTGYLCFLLTPSPRKGPYAWLSTASVAGSESSDDVPAGRPSL